MRNTSGKNPSVRRSSSELNLGQQVFLLVRIDKNLENRLEMFEVFFVDFEFIFESFLYNFEFCVNFEFSSMVDELNIFKPC